MVSASAFRSLFLASAFNHDSPPRPKLSSFWRNRVERECAHHSQSSSDELPQIPRATLTEMTSMIGQARTSTYWPMEDEPEHRFSLPPREHCTP